MQIKLRFSCGDRKRRSDAEAARHRLDRDEVPNNQAAN
jgi:hypothetical protein